MKRLLTAIACLFSVTGFAQQNYFTTTPSGYLTRSLSFLSKTATPDSTSDWAFYNQSTGKYFTFYSGVKVQGLFNGLSSIYVPQTRQIINGYGITGGHSFATDITLAVDTATSITSKNYFNGKIGTGVATALAGKQTLLGYTPEDVANKATSFSTISNTLYPSTQAVYNYVASFGYGTGTVTSITPGYGFTSATPITTSGTLTTDSTKLLTVTRYKNNQDTLYNKYLQNIHVSGSNGKGGIFIPYNSNDDSGGNTVPTPSSGVLVYSNGNNKFGWKGTNGFTVSFLSQFLTGNIGLIIPNANGATLGTTNGNQTYTSAKLSPAIVYQTPTGTAGTDSIAVKIGATGKMGAIPGNTYAQLSASNLFVGGLQKLTDGTNGLQIGRSVSRNGIWDYSLTPSTSNVALYTLGTATALNGGTDISIGINGGAEMTVDATGTYFQSLPVHVLSFGSGSTSDDVVVADPSLGTLKTVSRSGFAPATGSTVYAPIASPTFTGTVTIPNGGVFSTPTSMTATNVTGLPLTTGVTGILPIANGGTGVSTGAVNNNTSLQSSSNFNIDGIGVAGTAFNTPTIYNGATSTNTLTLKNYSGATHSLVLNPLTISHIGTSTVGGVMFQSAVDVVNPTSGGAGIGFSSINTYTNTTNAGATQYGYINQNKIAATATGMAGIVSFYAAPTILAGATGTITNVNQFISQAGNASASNITTVTHFSANNYSNTGGGTVTNQVGVSFPTVLAAATNNTVIAHGGTPTGNWFLYNNSAYNSYSGTGNFQIGTATPTAGAEQLQVATNASIGTSLLIGTTVNNHVYTVATLPAAGTAGRTAVVSDATAPTYLGALTGGGAVKTPVFDNGSAWVSY